MCDWLRELIKYCSRFAHPRGDQDLRHRRSGRIRIAPLCSVRHGPSTWIGNNFRRTLGLGGGLMLGRKSFERTGTSHRGAAHILAPLGTHSRYTECFRVTGACSSRGSATVRITGPSWSQLPDSSARNDRQDWIGALSTPSLIARAHWHATCHSDAADHERVSFDTTE